MPFQILSPFIANNDLWGRCYYCFFVTDEEAEVQRAKYHRALSGRVRISV